MKCKLPTEIRQKMQNWENFITCNGPTGIRGKVLNWADFINCNSLTELREKMQNWAYFIKCNAPTRIREKVQQCTVQCNTVKYSTVQYSTIKYITVPGTNMNADVSFASTWIIHREAVAENFNVSGLQFNDLHQGYLAEIVPKFVEVRVVDILSPFTIFLSSSANFSRLVIT